MIEYSMQPKSHQINNKITKNTNLWGDYRSHGFIQQCSHLPGVVSHLSPLKPVGQAHLYWPEMVPVRQVPSFKQGDEAQGLTKENKMTPQHLLDQNRHTKFQLLVYNTWVLIKSKVWTNNTSIFSALLILEWMIPCSFLLFKRGLIVKLMVKSCAIIVSSKRQHRKQQQKATNSIRQI